MLNSRSVIYSFTHVFALFVVILSTSFRSNVIVAVCRLRSLRFVEFGKQRASTNMAFHNVSGVKSHLRVVLEIASKESIKWLRISIGLNVHAIGLSIRFVFLCREPGAPNGYYSRWPTTTSCFIAQTPFISRVIILDWNRWRSETSWHSQRFYVHCSCFFSIFQ